jgi:type 1 fimbriae regulatory protein FimB/type 1 fimbriae regulatory protein FimE
MGVRAMTEILAGVDSTGYKLANDGNDTRSIQDYLGHQNIRHTVRYTELSPSRFKDFWR